jgi:N-acetylglucosaminyl-diphospho-decaprenol L-rhamnosyltransferase
MSRAGGRLAVVVVTRDRAASLDRTLTRLEELPERPRVLVADNGSADGTATLVRSRHPGVELLELGENLGCGGRTAGARRLHEPYLAFSDDDSWWAPGALDRAAVLLDRHPRLAVVAARVLVGPTERLDPVCAAMAASPLAPERLPGLDAGDLPGPPVLGFVACGAVVRRSAFLAVGGFDGRFGIGGEEELLAVDLAEAGWGLAYAGGVVAHHHPSPARDPAARRRVQLRNALWCAWLRRPVPSALRRTAELLRAAQPAARAGVLDALRGLGWVLRERRPVRPELDAALRLLGL